MIRWWGPPATRPRRLLLASIVLAAVGRQHGRCAPWPALTARRTWGVPAWRLLAGTGAIRHASERTVRVWAAGRRGCQVPAAARANTRLCHADVSARRGPLPRAALGSQARGSAGNWASGCSVRANTTNPGCVLAQRPARRAVTLRTGPCSRQACYQEAMHQWFSGYHSRAASSGGPAAHQVRIAAAGRVSRRTLTAASPDRTRSKSRRW